MAGSGSLNPSNIRNLLDEVDRELGHGQERVEMYVAGGARMIPASRSTGPAVPNHDVRRRQRYGQGKSFNERMRTLLVHQAEGFSERGLPLSFGWDATPSTPGADGAGGPVVGRFGAERGRGPVEQPDGLRHGLAPDVRLRRAGRRRGGLRASGGRPIRGNAARQPEESRYGRDY